MGLIACIHWPMIPRKQREETFDTSSEQRKAETSRRSRREEGKFKTIPDWTRLSTDSASRCNPAHAGAGRLVRDALHRFIMGSEAGVGYGNVLKDESWVVKIGLEMAWNMGVWWLLLVFRGNKKRPLEDFKERPYKEMDKGEVRREAGRGLELQGFVLKGHGIAFQTKPRPKPFRVWRIFTGDCSLVDRQSSQVAGGFNGGAVAIQRWKLQVLTEGAHPPMCLINHSWEYFLDPWEVFKGQLGDGVHPKQQRMKGDRRNQQYMDEMVGRDPNINIDPLYATL
ncbi:hypothetical protein IMY05_005G0163800 [Salix suchowensis]|nr:hypothetical protein IMY05_005G0163800 [Salix suchowensis]